MSNLLKFSEINDKIIEIRGQKVILDCDVAQLYDVATKEINQAVKNNPKKFPEGYVIELKNNEFHALRSKFLTANLEKTRVLPKAFTEKGLYMLATILKGDKAIDASITIIEAFAKLRELQTTVAEMTKVSDEYQQKSLMQKGGDIIAELIDNDLNTTEDETTIELNFAVFKVKHTVKRKKQIDK